MLMWQTFILKLQRKNRYDAVFLFEVTEHLLIPRKGIANVASLLRNNGYVKCSGLFSDCKGYMQYSKLF